MMSNLIMAPLMETKPPPAPFRPAIESKKSIKRNLFDSSPEESKVDTLLWEQQEKQKEYLRQRFNIDLAWLDEQEQLNKCNKIPISVNPKNEQKYSPYRRLEGIKGIFKVRKIIKQPLELQQKQCNNNNNINSNNNNNNNNKSSNNNIKETSHNSKMGATNGQQQKVEQKEVQEAAAKGEGEVEVVAAAAKGEVEVEGEVAAAKGEEEEENESAQAEEQQKRQ